MVAALSRWLKQKRVALTDLEERHIDDFLRARWRRVSKRCGEATLMALLQHLRDSQVIRTPAPEPLSELGQVEQEYGRFLTQERGLMQSIDLYLRLVSPLSPATCKRRNFDGKDSLPKM